MLALFANQASHLTQDDSTPSPVEMQRTQHIFGIMQRKMSRAHWAVAFNILLEARAAAEAHGL